jgi:hypothetical protein
MISQSAAASETLIYRIENVPLWHICDAQRMSPMSEKQTHRKLSGSVGLGQFSTRSGLNNLTG